MSRTKRKDRQLPGFTRGEEIANMTTHIVGAAYTLGIIFFAICTKKCYF